MAPTFRRRLGAAALAAAVGVGVFGLDANATPQFELQRRAGADRYATASAVAADAFTTANDAVIARGDGTPQQFADALAGSYLAGALGGGSPLLLTQRTSVPSSTRSRLQALGVKNVTILGGTGAVTAAVEADLADDFAVTRIQGTDRYDTAAKIATSQPAASIGQVDGKRTALLATGLDAADALAAGPLSFARRLPILLTQRTSLPAQTKAALTELAIAHVVILGGTAAVSDAVEAEIKTTGATTERVQGVNRYATAAAVADFAVDELAFSNTAVDLANGLNPADALAGGPAAGKAVRPILLTAPTSLPTATSQWLTKMSGTLVSGRIFGGTAAVSAAVEAAAENAGRGSSTTNSGEIVSVDKANNRYAYFPAGGTQSTPVTYSANDTFTVDGQSATLGGFENALTPADTINVVTTGTTVRHELRNVPPPTSGMAGNVSTADTSTPGGPSTSGKFDIIHPVTGDWLNQNITYATGTSFRVDGGAPTSDPTQFEQDINEGDSIAVVNNVISLTNQSVTGLANSIEKPQSTSLPNATTRFKIGNLGDNPEATGANNDDKFVASGGSGTTADQFQVDSNSNASYDQFNTALSEGDRVVYSRQGGVERYVLTNLPPATINGQAVGAITKDSDGLPLTSPDNDGGSFTIATASGSQTITYGPSGTFVLNGRVASEAEVEAAYSPGDRISFRPADSFTSTAQRFELTDQPLSGQVKPSSINTTSNPTVENPSRPAKSYAVLAENGTTELGTAVYGDGNDTFVVNGQNATIQQFETELNAIKANTKVGTVVVQTAANGTQTHNLTTGASS